MKLASVSLTDHPNGTRRLTGIVEYADGTSEGYWFEGPSEFELSSSGNPWLACLLPLAATLGEDLTISLPVDPQLLEGAQSALRLWKAWYPALSLVSIHAETAPLDLHPSQKMSFFSAGVDSFFTVLRHPGVQYFVNVLGFDMPITNEAAFRRHCLRLSQIATDLGATLVPIITNLRQTRWRTALWETLSHGPALAAVGLLLERYVNQVLIASSYDYSILHPWGSHPLSDPLFSTAHTQVIHDGTPYSRVEKTKFIAQHDIALRTLHVCFRGKDGHGQDDSNCCRCSKCYRTMITLDLLGEAPQCPTFDWSVFNRPLIGKVYCEVNGDIYFYEELYRLAIERGCNDVAALIRKSIKGSRRISRINYLYKVPFFWRAALPLKKRALRNWISI